MDVGKRRVGGVRTGSVWESRMKLDEVRGGIKVFNGEETTEEKQNQLSEKNNVGTKVKRNQFGTPSGKRKTWKSESFEGFEKNPIQIARGKTEEKRNSDAPQQTRKVARSEIERSPVGIRRPRSELSSPKPKSEVVKVSVEKIKDVVGVSGEETSKEVVEEIEKSTMEKCEGGGSESDDACKEFGVCQEKAISGNVEVANCTPNYIPDHHDDDGGDEKDGEEEVVEDEIEVEVEVEVEKKSVEMVKEIETPNEVKSKPNNKVENEEKSVVSDCQVKKVNFERREVRKVHQVHHQKQPDPISLNVKKQPPVLRRSTLHSSFAKGPPTKSPPSSNEYQSFPETHSRLQSFVDLIMWKEISRSVFIFGLGTFTIVSSSYTKDLNISFISVMSYLGLVYLAAIFLFRSIVCRGVIDIDYTSYVLGEEEAIWLLKLVLPYLNEFLLKLKALFSGDPATTMKLAVLLFVLARCGSSVTIWTMAKLGFFGVFTVPKVCSLYSTQITAYAKFWVRRFRDAWDSCSHKKAVTVAVFLLVWNLSSIVARIWAVFMLFVAFRYYQQTLVREDWVEDGAEDEDTWYEPNGGQRQEHGPTIVDTNTKQKKRS
ncbi:hypothetical protein TIFTF001_026084 [Ficus carica]|uniref:Reticulon-like protein n=1 Tax=Ficus carica TaxID=3494 RepID=A0AA88APR3_FICCA|nr:hypothetical protein TIFTF001_026084 [Ficus carica]